MDMNNTSTPVQRRPATSHSARCASHDTNDARGYQETVVHVDTAVYNADLPRRVDISETVTPPHR